MVKSVVHLPSCKTWAGNVLSCRRGVVAIEVALWLPALILVAVGLLDIVRYIEATTRMDRAAASVADLIARNSEIRDQTDFAAPSSASDLGSFLLVGNELAKPDSLIDDGRIIITSITTAAAGFAINWQRTGLYGLDTESSLKTLPDLPTGTSFVVAEVFFRFDPILAWWTKLLPGGDTIIYRRAIYRPRLAALTSLRPAS